MTSPHHYGYAQDRVPPAYAKDNARNTQSCAPYTPATLAESMRRTNTSSLWRHLQVFDERRELSMVMKSLPLGLLQLRTANRLCWPYGQSSNICNLISISKSKAKEERAKEAAGIVSWKRWRSTGHRPFLSYSSGCFLPAHPSKWTNRSS